MRLNIRRTRRQPGKISIKGWGLVILACLSGGCKTKPPPAPVSDPPLVIEKTIVLQPVNREMADNLGEDSIRKFQYYISSQVILFRESSRVFPRNNDGSLELTNTYTREMITIDGKTKGVISSFGRLNGRKAFKVCFEPDNDDAFLVFLESGDDGFFTLYAPNGTTGYGGETYRVLQAEKTTRLLINMETRDDVQNEQRFVFGRVIDTGTGPAPMDPYTVPRNVPGRPYGETEGPVGADPQREEDARLLRVLENYLTQIEDGTVYATSRDLDDIRQAVIGIKTRNNLPQ